MSLQAVIFDVDGTIAETEHDGHQVAFNRAFEQYGLPDRWNDSLYGRLLNVAGGRERLQYYFDNHRPLPEGNHPAAATAIHRLKNRILLEIIDSPGLLPRPGILRLLDELHQSGIRTAIATTGSRAWVIPLLHRLLGAERLSRLDPIVTGDEVRLKKPDPAAYRIALKRLGIPATAAVAIEDSDNGLRAAVSAGIACLCTPDRYSGHHDLGTAALVVDTLGDPEKPASVLTNPLNLSVGSLIDRSLLQQICRSLAD